MNKIKNVLNKNTEQTKKKYRVNFTEPQSKLYNVLKI